MKKLESLGRILTAGQLRKIIGGSDEQVPIGGGGGSAADCNCNSKDDCTDPVKKTCYAGSAYGCTAGTYVGWCEA